MTQFTSSELAEVLANTLKAYKAKEETIKEFKTHMFVLSEDMRCMLASELISIEPFIREAYYILDFKKSDSQDYQTIWNLSDTLENIGMYEDEIRAYKDDDESLNEDYMRYLTYEEACIVIIKDKYSL